MAARHSPHDLSSLAMSVLHGPLADLAQAARTAARAQACGVWLLDETAHLALRAHDGLRHAGAVTPVAPADWFALTAAAAVDAAEAPAAARAWLAAEGARTVVVVPLVVEDRTLGSLVVLIDGRAPAASALRRVEEAAAAGVPAVAAAVAYAAMQARAERAEARLAELTAAQQRLIRAETLRAIGELAGGAAHHLNNLLTIVVGRVQLLLRTVGDERIHRPLEIVERAAKDGAEVVRRLQQFSRMREVTQTRRIDLNTVVADVVEMTRGHWQEGARARGVAIEVETRTAAVVAVAGDPAGLREAVTNLVLNAVEAMPKGGRITIETAAGGETVTLAVSDTGAGMSEDVRTRAHEPFFTTKGVKATGLGLSVAYGIARRHRGQLTIASAPGEGSTITLRLPALMAAEPAPMPAPLPAGAARRHVLLVDDEREVCDAMAEMLAAQGHTVLTAGNGADAMEWVETEPGLEVVLTDLVMPGMTGWQVAAAVKACRPHIAVGLISGRQDAAPPADEGGAAIDFVMDKPVTLAAFNEALARVRPR
jgi:signal transduction histidine kinase/CheY-like chemotaxis protein